MILYTVPSAPLQPWTSLLSYYAIAALAVLKCEANASTKTEDKPNSDKTLYKSILRSLLEYCCPLWNPRKELEGVQRTFTARIAGVQHLDYWEGLKKLSIMSLQRRRERYILLHMWKILNGSISNDLGIQFVSRPRTGFKAVVPPLRVGVPAYHQSLYDNSFAVSGPRLWNCLPAYINTMGGFDSFKRQLTSLLLRIPDQPPVQGYTSPNTISILEWRTDSATLELWGGQES